MHDSSTQNAAICQALFEQCQEAIVILTGKAQVLDVNEAWLDLFGCARRSLAGMPAGAFAAIRMIFIGSKATWSETVRSKTTTCSSAGRMKSKSIVWSASQPGETRTGCAGICLSYGM